MFFFRARVMSADRERERETERERKRFVLPQPTCLVEKEKGCF